MPLNKLPAVFFGLIFLLFGQGYSVKSWEALPFPILAWFGPQPEIANDTIFQDEVKAGFNANFTHVYQATDLQRATNLRMLSTAAKVGLKLLMHDSRIDASKPVDAAALQQLDSVIMDYKDSTALLGYHIIDEPNSNLFANIAAIKNYLNEKDPDHLAYINLYPIWAGTGRLGSSSYQEHVDDYMRLVRPQVLSYDNYGITDGGLRTDYYQNLEIIRDAALKNDVPFWAFTLSTSHVVYPMPTEGHIRFQLYSDLAYGAKGLQYFTYAIPGSPDFILAPINADGSRTPIWYMVQNVNREIMPLTPLLKSFTNTAVYHSEPLPEGTTGMPADFLIKSASSPLVAGCFKDSNNTNYIMLVNRDYTNSKSIIISVSDSVDSMVEVSKLNGSELPGLAGVDGNSITLEFTAGEGRLYRIVKTGTTNKENEAAVILTDNLYFTASPNPFNSSVNIHVFGWQIGMELKIINVNGKVVADLTKVQNSGTVQRQVVWNASGQAPGVYFVLLKNGRVELKRKTILIR